MVFGVKLFSICSIDAETGLVGAVVKGACADRDYAPLMTNCDPFHATIITNPRNPTMRRTFSCPEEETRQLSKNIQ